MFLRHFLLAAVLVFVSACETKPLIVNEDPLARQAALERLEAFRVTGGLSLWTDEQSISTRIDWRQSGQDFNVLIRLPAGLSRVRISQTKGQAVVRRTGASPVSGPSAALLLQQALGLGVAVPIEQMSLWVRGLPGQQATSVTFDEKQRLASLDYRDSQGTLWHAKVSKYKVFDTGITNIYVPASILATGGPYNVRLVLKSWSKIALEELAPPISAKLEGAGTGRLKLPGE